MGHNFDSEKGFAQSLARGTERLNGATWRPLLSLLIRTGISLHECFFTSAYMGLKAGSKPTGKFPGACDTNFIRRCQDFLLEQLRVQQPRLVLTLGKEVPPVLAPLAPGLRLVWMHALSLQTLDQRDAALVYPVQFAGVPHLCAVVALTHPANRSPNVARRCYKGLNGDGAEMALLRDARARAGSFYHNDRRI